MSTDVSEARAASIFSLETGFNSLPVVQITIENVLYEQMLQLSLLLGSFFRLPDDWLAEFWRNIPPSSTPKIIIASFMAN
jgi:hypothetical protein